MPLDLSNITPLSTEPYPYNELQEACLRDLETTDAPQAGGCLERMNDSGKTLGYCCLGRFCIVAGEAREVKEGSLNVRFGEMGEVAGLPSSLAKTLKLQSLGDLKRAVFIYKNGARHGLFTTLTGINDSGCFTFKDIAAYIRYDPWNVFTDDLPEIGEVAA